MPQFPVLLAGQRFTAAVAQSMVPTYINKATSLPAVVSSVTLVNDAEFVGIPLGIGVWDIAFYLYVTADATAGTTGRIQTAWTFTGTATGFRSTMGPGPAQTSATNIDNNTHRDSIHGFGTTVAYGAKGTGTFARIEERSGNFTVTAAGTLALQYSQVVSSTTATSVQAGSYMTYRQVG